MNFERLVYDIFTKRHLLRDKKKALLYIYYHYDLLEWKREKWKLGKVSLEVKTYSISDIKLFEDIEMKFVRQDTTVEDELKLENQLKELDWKWDFNNVGAFIIISTIILSIIYAMAYNWFCEHLPALAFRQIENDELIRYTFREVFMGNFPEIFKIVKVSNVWMYEALTNFAIKCNILL
jgi:hypothetical protein